MSGVHSPRTNGDRALKSAALLLLAGSLAACSTLGASGPSSQTVRGAAEAPVGQARIKIIDVNDAVTRQVMRAASSMSFAEVFGEVPPVGSMIGAGDVLEVTIWEAPPAALFSGNASFGIASTPEVLASSAGSTQKTALPAMMVDSGGFIRVPFAGTVRAAGLTPQQIEREIARRLSGKAHDPQVIVNIAGNANDSVTVVGDVVRNARVPLTPRGERLLDAIASAGGVGQPVGKVTVQITRGERVLALPLDRIIRDPAQNIRLQAEDVVTAFHRPFSFTSLGATGMSAEIPFEATGLTLSQALGRVGGLRDDRANIRGVFIFRLENPAAVDPAIAATAPRTPDGKIPVIYRVDLSNPASFFVAQNFPIHDKDVLYASTAPLADIQRFVGMVSSMAFTLIGLGQAVP